MNNFSIFSADFGDLYVFYMQVLYRAGAGYHGSAAKAGRGGWRRKDNSEPHLNLFRLWEYPTCFIEIKLFNCATFLIWWLDSNFLCEVFNEYNIVRHVYIYRYVYVRFSLMVCTRGAHWTIKENRLSLWLHSDSFSCPESSAPDPHRFCPSGSGSVLEKRTVSGSWSKETERNLQITWFPTFQMAFHRI